MFKTLFTLSLITVAWAQSPIPVENAIVKTDKDDYLVTASGIPPLAKNQVFEQESHVLEVPVPSDLCNVTGVVVGKGKIALADRGSCAFTVKSEHAAMLGYEAVVVRNTVRGVYAQNGNRSMDGGLPVARACDFDCGSGEKWVSLSGLGKEEVLDGVGCGSGVCEKGKLCVLTGKTRGGLGQVCCARDSPLVMGGTKAPSKGVPSFFARLDVGVELNQTWMGRKVRVGLREPVFPWSSLVLMALSTVIVTVGAIRATRREQKWLQDGVLGRDGMRIRESGQEEEEEEEEDGDPVAQTLTIWQGVGLVCCAGVMLGGLYGLLVVGVNIVYIVYGFFAIAATSSLMGLVADPLFFRYLPMLYETRRALRVPYVGLVALGDVVAFVVSAGVVALFIGVRLMSWSWVLQDLLGGLVCCAVLLAIRLPSLKVGTIFGIIFLLYDVFMVFLTPLIFRGSSVMVDVATAGGPKAQVDPACHCRLYPDDLASCGAGESMPIVLRMPRFADWRGGYSLLGLGDVIIPGLVVVFALRADLAFARRFGPYLIANAAAYAIGIALAMTAVALTGLGQPALLYLMPATLLATAITAYTRGELPKLWAGFGNPTSPDSGHIPLTPIHAPPDDIESLRRRSP